MSGMAEVSGDETCVGVLRREKKIYEAVVSGDLDEVVRLIEGKHASVDEKDKGGWTPLMYSITNGQKEICEWLLRNGADANETSYDGNYTPLIVAALSASSEWFTQKIANYADEASINQANKKGETALHIAARRSLFESCAILVHEGADVNSKDKFWNTPLHLASNSLEISQLLIRNGAIVNVTNAGMFRPIDFAAKNGNEKVCNLLIENGADLGPSSERNTPLHFAAMNGHRLVCETLLENGASINAVNDFKLTPLDFAFRKQQYGIVEFLEDNDGKKAKDMKSTKRPRLA